MGFWEKTKAKLTPSSESPTVVKLFGSEGGSETETKLKAGTEGFYKGGLSGGVPGAVGGFYEGVTGEEDTSEEDTPGEVPNLPDSLKGPEEVRYDMIARYLAQRNSGSGSLLGGTALGTIGGTTNRRRTLGGQ